MRATGVLLIAVICAALAWSGNPDIVAKGRAVFQKRCTGCHAIDAIKVGPPLRGVYGRRSASDPRFPYSDALRKAEIIWKDAQLDKWLADPDTVVPGNDMSFRLTSAEERAAIVAFLKQLAPKEDNRP